jgi:hypothetical protein
MTPRPNLVMDTKFRLWHQLVDNWCLKDGKYGLTIPYLVEAERRYANRKDFVIEQLIDEVCDARQIYVISNCGDLDEYVIGLVRAEYPPVHLLKTFGNLAINDVELEKLNSVFELKQLLFDLYEKNIENLLVSKNYYTGEWSNFDQEDQENITKAIV